LPAAGPGASRVGASGAAASAHACHQRGGRLAFRAQRVVLDGDRERRSLVVGETCTLAVVFQKWRRIDAIWCVKYQHHWLVSIRAAASLRPHTHRHEAGAGTGGTSKKVSKMATPRWLSRACKALRKVGKPPVIISWSWIWSKSDLRWPRCCSAAFWQVPRGALERACSDSSALLRQAWIARGNSRSRSKKAATCSGVMRPWRLRYISKAPTDLRTADHWRSWPGIPPAMVAGRRRTELTSSRRAVISARSSSRPSRPK